MAFNITQASAVSASNHVMGRYINVQLHDIANTNLFPLLALLFGITFHLQLVLLSYHPIFLRPYHFLKLVSFEVLSWS